MSIDHISFWIFHAVSISLEKPRKNNPPPFPWEQPDPAPENDKAGKFSNRAIQEHPDSLQNLTEKLKTETMVQRSKNEVTKHVDIYLKIERIVKQGQS